MQLPLLRVFLAACLAHLVGDFPFQPGFLLERKRFRWWAILAHGVIHWILLALCLIFFATPLPLVPWRLFLLTFVYVAIHLLVDAARQHFFADSILVLAMDQVLHLATIVGLTICITNAGWHEIHSLVAPAHSTRDLMLSGGIVYTTVIFAGGYLIRYMTRGLVHRLPTEVVGEPTEQLKNAGLYIGWLERLLIITAVVLRSPALIGLILTGKSIARFPEMKEPKFAEYFLIGTLLSICIALFGGLVLLKAWHGTVSLQP
jgi:hypothetical protein